MNAFSLKMYKRRTERCRSYLELLKTKVIDGALWVCENIGVI